MERATAGEVGHALTIERSAAAAIMGELADHGLRVSRIAPDPCADREDEASEDHEPVTVEGELP